MVLLKRASGILASNLVLDNNFVPFAESVVLSNLRQTVLALANANVNADLRLNFRNMCAIPGTIWDAQNVLLNPDEIIPDGYNDDSLNDDIIALIAHKEYVAAKYPKYLEGGKIDWENFSAGKDLLVCNNMAQMHVTERIVNQPLLDYTRNTKYDTR